MIKIRLLLCLFALAHAGFCPWAHAASTNFLAAIRAGGDSSNKFFLFSEVYSDADSYKSGMLVPLLIQDSMYDSHHRLRQQKPAFKVLGADEFFVDMTSDKNGNIFILAQKNNTSGFSGPLLVCLFAVGGGSFVIERFEPQSMLKNRSVAARALSVNDMGNLVLLSEFEIGIGGDNESLDMPLFMHMTSVEKLRESRDPSNKRNKRGSVFQTSGIFYNFSLSPGDLGVWGSDVHVNDQKNISILIQHSSKDGADKAHAFKKPHKSSEEGNEDSHQLFETFVDLEKRATNSSELPIRNTRFLPNQTEVAHFSLSLNHKAVITVHPKKIEKFRTQIAPYSQLSQPQGFQQSFARAANGKFFSVGIGWNQLKGEDVYEFMIQEFDAEENTSRTYGVPSIRVEGYEDPVCAHQFM